MARGAATDRPLANEPDWPAADGRGVLFLIDAPSRLERRLVEAWIERHRPATVDASNCDAIPIPSSRRSRRGRLDPRLEAALATDDDPLLAPLRVIWRAKLRDGTRAVRFSDLLTFSDPRDPGRLRQAWVLRREPDRCRIVAGEPAPLSELRERWGRSGGSDSAQTQGLAEFVVRQATLALERGERRLRGARYKVPRFVREEIVARPGFRGGLARLARELRRSERSVGREASRYLREIAATHDPFVIDLVSHLIRLLYTQGYGEVLHYDREELRGVYALAQRHPVVFLPSHRSNLDHLVLQYALHENGHPPNHTAAGINMNFFPVGLLVRRSGAFFIRRSFRDNTVYKFVLRSYIDYLIEKRFSLEWYIEGGRSRSGKLLPPRFGMLAYVVDAFRRGKSEDVFLVPVSIAYDQIQDVGAYAAEQRGAAKRKESLRWFIGVVRALRRRYGNIHIRFGEPISLRKHLGPPEAGAEPNPDERNLALQKLAFEVSARINRETPITPTSLVTLTLLGTGDRALSLEQTRVALSNLLWAVEKRNLPTTAEFDLRDAESMQRALDALVENGVVSCFREGLDAVYRIGPEQQLAAAYYRNTIVHFFVNGAIAELALLRAAEDGVADPGAEFWDEAMRLRDLLKFEFFFSEKERFRGELRHELSLYDHDWEARVLAGSAEIDRLVRRIRPFHSHRVLRAFVEAYRVVADALERVDPNEEIDERRFLARCLGLGAQYHLQRRVHGTDSISQVLFATALRLARNRGLVDTGAPEVAERRREFARYVHDVLRRIDGIDALAGSRRAGLID